MFVLEYFNIHCKNWVPILVELTDLVNSIIISNDLTQIVYFPTYIFGCDSYSPALLDLFVFSEASICSAITFPQLENSDHVAATISMDFPSNSKQDDPYHRIDYDYCRADWDGLRDYFRDAPWEDIFKLSVSAVASKFCEWVQVGTGLYIPHCEYQVKPHLSPWFSAACADSIVYRNDVFCV